MTRPAAPDKLDLEHLEQTTRTHGWQIYAARLAAEIERARAGVEAEPDAREVRYRQGLLHGLRVAAGLPERIAAEIRTRAGS